MQIRNNLFLETVRFVLLLCHIISFLFSFSQPVWIWKSPHQYYFFLIFCQSYKTVFDCQIIKRVKKRSFVTWGKTDFISIDKESVCILFSSVISGVRRSPPHWACHCPRGPAPAFPVFLCICWEFSTDHSAQLRGFILPPPRSSLLCLLDPSYLGYIISC